MGASHTNFAKVLHWGLLPLYLYGVFKQLDDLSQLEDASLLAYEVAFAGFFLFVLLTRYLYMRRFETFLGAREAVPLERKRFARGLHRSIYLCLALLPLSGMLIAGLFKLGIKDGVMQDLAVALHEFCASLSYLLIAVHVAAALYSRSKSEGIWSSMVPFWKEGKV